MPSSPESPNELSSELPKVDAVSETDSSVETLDDSEAVDTVEDTEPVDAATPESDVEDAEGDEGTEDESANTDDASAEDATPAKAEAAVDSFLHRPMTRRVALGVATIAAIEVGSEVATGGKGFLGRLFKRSSVASAGASSSASATAAATSATASATASASQSPSGEADPSASSSPEQTPGNPELPTPYEMWKMPPEQRLEAIRIPKEMLNDPKIVDRWLAIRNVIYNCGTDDREYKWFVTEGPGKNGEGYNNYIFDTYYKPLFTQLDNFVPIDKRTEGPRGFADRMANYTSLRIDSNQTDMAPYHVEGTPDSSRPAVIQGTDAVGYYRLHDSVDARIAELLKKYKDFPCIVFTNESHQLILRGLHFNEQLQTVQPASIESTTL